MLKSYPAILQKIPKAATNTPVPRIQLINTGEDEIRLAAISEKVIIPTIVVYAKRQKHKEKEEKNLKGLKEEHKFEKNKRK